MSETYQSTTISIFFSTLSSSLSTNSSSFGIESLIPCSTRSRNISSKEKLNKNHVMSHWPANIKRCEVARLFLLEVYWFLSFVSEKQIQAVILTSFPPYLAFDVLVSSRARARSQLLTKISNALVLKSTYLAFGRRSNSQKCIFQGFELF
jgi:hypothetical protein